MPSLPAVLLYGRTALGANVPVLVDADGLLAGGGNPFDQSLNTDDSPTFDTITVNECIGCGSGSLPAGGVFGDTLQLTGEFTNPTTAAVLAEHPEIMPTWASATDFTYGDSGDVVVCFHGDTGVFCGEVTTGDLTGAMEPDWDGDAPNIGDPITDGDLTLYRAYDFVDWPPAAVAWQANHHYTNFTFVHPTTANGHLYLSYTNDFTSDSSEPDFNSITFSNYIADNDGYWMDAGTDGSVPPTTPAWGSSISFSAGEGIHFTEGDSIGSILNTPTAGGSLIVAEVAVNDDRGFGISLSTTWDGGDRSANGTAGTSIESIFNVPVEGLLGDTYLPLNLSASLSIRATPSDGVWNAYFKTYASNSVTVPSLANIAVAKPAISGGATIVTNWGLWMDDQSSASITNSYYEWFDSQGVFRIKEDSTFDSVGQAIATLYNPQFTKYTPGAANFERVVMGQWNGNVAEIGNEKGGTGTLRNLRLIGGGLEFHSNLVAPASSGTRYLCISTAGVVTSSASACSGT